MAGSREISHFLRDAMSFKKLQSLQSLKVQDVYVCTIIAERSTEGACLIQL